MLKLWPFKDYAVCHRPLTARKWVPGRPVQCGGYSDTVAGCFEYLNIPFQQWSILYGAFHNVPVITNIYNKKTKGHTLMELFTAIEKRKKLFFTTRDVRCVHHGWHGTHPCLNARIIAAVKNIDVPMLTRVWQELEYRIDVFRVTRGAHIEHL
jgi:hypothetical protein